MLCVSVEATVAWRNMPLTYVDMLSHNDSTLPIHVKYKKKTISPQPS